MIFQMASTRHVILGSPNIAGFSLKKLVRESYVTGGDDFTCTRCAQFDQEQRPDTG